MKIRWTLYADGNDKPILNFDMPDMIASNNYIDLEIESIASKPRVCHTLFVCEAEKNEGYDILQRLEDRENNKYYLLEGRCLNPHLINTKLNITDGVNIEVYGMPLSDSDSIKIEGLCYTVSNVSKAMDGKINIVIDNVGVPLSKFKRMPPDFRN